MRDREKGKSNYPISDANPHMLALMVVGSFCVCQFWKVDLNYVMPHKVIPTVLLSHCKRNESWGVNFMEHKNKSCIIYKLVLTIGSKIYHWIKWNMMNTWCKTVLLVNIEEVILECMFGSKMTIVDFEWISYVKLILTENEFKVKIFLFRYISFYCCKLGMIHV